MQLLPVHQLSPLQVWPLPRLNSQVPALQKAPEAQLLSCVQVLRQAPRLHMPGVQGVGSGMMQLPAMHVPAPWNAELDAQNVPEHCEGGSGLQLPRLPVLLHELQVLQESLLQQTKSTQSPVAHSLPPPHGRPDAFLGTQSPGIDVLPLHQ